MPVGPESEMSDVQVSGYRWWQFQAGEYIQLPAKNLPETELDLDPGTYVFNLFVSWNNLGDASYGFLVQVE